MSWRHSNAAPDAHAVDILERRGVSGGTADEEAMTGLKVNGQTRAIDADPDKPLLWVLREDLGVTDTQVRLRHRRVRRLRGAPFAATGHRLRSLPLASAARRLAAG